MSSRWNDRFDVRLAYHLVQRKRQASMLQTLLIVCVVLAHPQGVAISSDPSYKPVS